MILELKIPSPGESISEAVLANWLVADGDYVYKNQEVAEVESDKATLPLIAAESGSIKFFAKTGDTVKIGSVAATIDTSALAPESKAVSKVEAKTADIVNAKAVIPAKSELTEKASESSSAIKISPVAQKMMDDNGLSVDDILAGLKRIGKAEVEAVLYQSAQVAQPKTEKSRGEDRKKITPLRKKLSERLVAVKNQTAMLTTFNEVDMSAIMELRKKYQPAFEAKYGVKLGFMSFFAKSVALAAKLHPSVNSMIDGEEIVTPDFCDVSFAVQTDKGLMVPVLRNVESLSLAEIEQGVADLASKARAGRLPIADMTGGTFTITNGGVFGSLLSTPIINPPQSAILGMHNVVDRPVAVNGKVEIRPMMYIALSYDHRIIDGKDSVGFLVRVKQFIENPMKMLYPNGDPEKNLLAL